MKLNEASKIAERLANILRPWCERIEIAGSIRRKKLDVGDIEIVCIPKGVIAKFEQSHDLFGNTEHVVTKTAPCKEFIDAVNIYPKIKGEPDGSYTQRMLPEGIKADIFMCHADNWGYILSIRTGSADFSKEILASTWVKYGYKGINGMLYRNGIPVPVREEKELFELLGLKYVEPPFRSL